MHTIERVSLPVGSIGVGSVTLKTAASSSYLASLIVNSVESGLAANMPSKTVDRLESV